MTGPKEKMQSFRMLFTRIREHVPTWKYPGFTNDRVKYRVCFLLNRLHHEYVEKLIKSIFHSQELDEHIAEINVLENHVIC